MYYSNYFPTELTIFLLLVIVIVPMIMCIFMANNRTVAVVPWVLLSLVLSFVAPVLLGVMYQTPRKAAMRRKAIEMEYDNMYNKKTPEQ